MKLDYLSDESIGQPIVRLYDFTTDEIKRLHSVFRNRFHSHLFAFIRG